MKRRKTSKKRNEKFPPMSNELRSICKRKDSCFDVAERVFAKRPTCEAGRAIGLILIGEDTHVQTTLIPPWLLIKAPDRLPQTVPVFDKCARTPCEVHIVDETRLFAVCRACHRWIHDNPKHASVVKLLAPPLVRS